MNWIAEVSESFPRGEDTPLPYPVKSFFVCERQKILYAPIAKVACSSIKTLMVELCQMEHQDVISTYGVHRVTDAFNTGAQLKDHDLDSVRRMLNHPEYYKFAVIREPLARIVSAYTEKFWRNRQQQDNKACTQHALRTVQGAANPDFDKSISFREFVDYITGSDPADLDPHWAPQHQFLAGPDQYNDIFTLEQLDVLTAKLSNIVGTKVDIAALNVSLEPGINPQDPSAGRLADTPVTQLDDIESAGIEVFLAADLTQKLRDYYRADLELYEAASKGLQNFRPPQVTLAGQAKTIKAKDSPQDIGQALQLYSKGFFGLSDSGRADVPVVIFNGSMQPLNMSALSTCHLQCILRDDAGNSLHEPILQPVYLSTLPVGKYHNESLAIEVPLPVRDKLRFLNIALVFNDNFEVAQTNPLHATSVILAN